MEGLRGRVASRLPSHVIPRLSALVHGESRMQRALQRRLLRWRTKPSRARLEIGEVTPVGGLAVPLLAVETDRFSASQVLDDNLALVADALEGGDVPYVVIEAATMTRRVVAIEIEHAAAVRRALARRYAHEPVHVSTVPKEDRDVRTVLAADLEGERAFAGTAPWRVFRAIAVGDAVLAGGELACEIEFWQHAGDVAVPPRSHRRVATVRPATTGCTTMEIGGRSFPTLEGLDRPHLMDVDFPVDAVYTWVDGTDPAWLRRKEEAWRRAHPDDHHPYSANPSRFQGHDELRYSLRSLSMYAGWVRTVYIVTDGQVPPWLRTDHPRIRVVDHRDIFSDPGLLPTFNSHAIESQLHHVDGLSEHFLYFNDDVFIGRAVPPELFFHANGLARFFLSDQAIDLGDPHPDDLPVLSAAKVNRSVLQQHFGWTISHKLQHTPHALRRSVLYDIEKELDVEIRQTAASAFRSNTDLSVASALAHHYGYATARSVPGHLSYHYVDIGDPRLEIRLQRLLRHKDADVFCLNDVDTTDALRPLQAQVMREFLERYFPLPSPFEEAWTR
jgi:hypothetical protein